MTIEEPWHDYTLDFFREHHDDNHLGAYRAIARALWQIYPLTDHSVVTDAGCGTGGLLAALRRMGLKSFVGIEAPQLRAALRAAGWRIPEEQAVFLDLSDPIPEIFRGSAHLAISVEVAEHIPPDRAGVYLDNVSMLAPDLVFSAAFPGQGGTGHVHETEPTFWMGELQARGMLLDVDRTARLQNLLRGSVRGLSWYEHLYCYHRS